MLAYDIVYVIHIFFIFLLFTCWGSFLNVIAYRIIFEEKFSLLTRSHCIHCASTVAWYDLFPIFSFMWLRGKCRFCTKKITAIYPFIELISGIFFTLLIAIKTSFFFPYFILFSALIICIRTDLESLLLCRFFTLFLVPVGFLSAYLDVLPITLMQSFTGAVFGYVILYVVNKLFFLAAKKEGLGEGDMDLLALIGSFCGIAGAWFTLLIGSILGSIIGLVLIVFGTVSQERRIPFGPFLAIAAMLFVLFDKFMYKIMSFIHLF